MQCHSEPHCPPCTVMVEKNCYGGHETRTSVLCYMSGVSCGKTCNKPMSCGQHRCQRVCHEPGCGDCTYACTRPRPICGHPCAITCHGDKPCPGGKCNYMMKVTCACGRLTDQQPCHVVNDANARMTTSLMAKIRMQDADSVDVSSLIKKAQENKHCRLECDAVCAQVERNRKLAEALDIKEADVSPKAGPPNYPETLKQFALENMDFITAVHDQMASLVKEANASRMSFKNHNFPSMRPDQRQAVHEYAEFFGLKSHSVDQEPIRSVVVKAVKSKCFLPTVSVMDVVKKKSWLVLSQNGKGQVKGRSELVKPPPVTAPPATKEPAWSASRPPPIDYFDFDG